MIKIRKATAEDLPAVYGFVCALENFTLDPDPFKELYEQNIQRSDYYYLIAEQDAPVGFVSLHTQGLLHHGGYTGEIQELYVQEDYRGRGVGQQLLAEVARIAEAQDLREVEVTAHRSREATHQFYQSNGYTHSHLKFTKAFDEAN